MISNLNTGYWSIKQAADEGRERKKKENRRKRKMKMEEKKNENATNLENRQPEKDEKN